MTTKKIPPITQIYNHVTNTMQVGREGIRLEEWDVVQTFWAALTPMLNPHKHDGLMLTLIEEALILRIITHRLLRELETSTDPDESTIDFKGTGKAWLTTQERLRTIMKDILKHYGRRTDQELNCLAKLMAPILKQSEGIIEDALEFETRKKSTQKNNPKQPRNTGMAPPA